LLVAMSLVSGLAVMVLGYLWLSEEYGAFARESEEMRLKYYDEQKARVRDEVERVLDYINYRHSRTEEVLRASLRSRVGEAHAIATRIWEVERSRRPRAEIERLVREALRPIRFNNDRGYFFAVTMRGVEKLYPVAPELEDTSLLDLQDAKGNLVIRDEIALLARQPEGFVFDYWRKPNASDAMVHPKMTFVRRFEPFDWYIGTGEYLDDYEHDLQEELLDRVAHLRFGTEGYVFINTYDGDALITDGRRVTTPTNLWELTDPNGVKVIQQERRVCDKPGGDFIYYTWNRLTRAEPAPKVSFVRAYPAWRWMVGAGVYLDEIEAVLAARRVALDQRLRARLLGAAGIVAGLVALIAGVAALFLRRTRRSFDAFSEFFASAATSSTAIDEKDLHFSEFVGLARSANTMIEARRTSEAEKRRLEEQLLRSKKMEALGLLTGGVAHDLNNILSGVVMYPDLLLMELPPDSPYRRRVTAIKESGLRAAAVVADLLAASRGGRAGSEVVSPNAAVMSFLQSAEQRALADRHPGVAVQASLDSSVLNVRGSSSQLGKALMNLVANSMEAIQGTGRVTIATENRRLDRPSSGYETVPPGDYVVLRVEDTGAGIPAADLGRVFEPFFTKKILGRTGTGLGLTVVWHTVKGHEGYVDVRSGPAGTTIELLFPACREEVSGPQPPVPIDEFRGIGERILVVDDEPAQRDIASELLTRLGYDVTAVASGEEAVARVEREAFDLVVLDMIMAPGMDGRETYEAILRLRPGQRAVIASGYAETADIRATLAMGAGPAVLKPYTVEGFGLAVREALRRGAGEADDDDGGDPPDRR
jgi:signal transduction histidine kinase/nitrogen-specific signal transduction histidine kinase/ActR/RegA family two-component response regulator